MNPCQVCAAATPHYLCLGCEVTLASLVATIPHLIGDLNVTLSKQSKQTPPTNGGSRPENPLPINMGALYAKQALEAALTRARAIHREPGTQEGIHRIALHPKAGSVYRQISEAHVAGTRVIDRQPERKRVGDCAAPAWTPEGTITWCDTPLFATQGQEVVVCPKKMCGAEWDVHDLRMDETVRVLSTECSLNQVSVFFQDRFNVRLPRSTVSQWVKDGVLGRGLCGGVVLRDVVAVWERKNDRSLLYREATGVDTAEGRTENVFESR